VYPTPPPGIAHSSSSLANALQEQPRPPRKVYEPETSAQFFNEFVTSKTKDLPIPAPVSKPPIPTPPATIPPVSFSSVPPHVQTPTLTSRVTEPQTMTPRKRKHEEDTEASIPKPQPPHHTSVNRSILPRKDLSSLPRIPKKNQVYVDVPPLPSTWKSQVPMPQSSAIRKPSTTNDGRSNDSHATAGPTTQYRSSSATSATDGRTSPVKRTGGRDDRGTPLKSSHLNVSDFFKLPSKNSSR